MAVASIIVDISTLDYNGFVTSNVGIDESDTLDFTVASGDNILLDTEAVRKMKA